MSSQNVNHNVWKPWSGAGTGDVGDLATAGAGVEGADLKTSAWYDTSGWTDRVIGLQVGSAGTIDFDLIMHISSQGAYELNNKTATTADYVAVSIVDALTTGVYTRYDSDDIDELKIPVRSTRFVINNDQAAVVSGTSLTLEGWS